ncbi:hypothetical protein MRX96_015096 [Rhipicephalus microplus]
MVYVSGKYPQQSTVPAASSVHGPRKADCGDEKHIAGIRLPKPANPQVSKLWPLGSSPTRLVRAVQAAFPGSDYLRSTKAGEPSASQATQPLTDYPKKPLLAVQVTFQQVQQRQDAETNTEVQMSCKSYATCRLSRGLWRP